MPFRAGGGGVYLDSGARQHAGTDRLRILAARSPWHSDDHCDLQQNCTCRHATGELFVTAWETGKGHCRWITLVQRYWLPTIRAAVALQRKDPNRAIELLKVASTVELGQPVGLIVYLCPAYLRGEAYLMLHDGNAATREFQKFI